ncbi:HlyD family type I secretion periplasmic adaptor subunit [Belnapia rosea]|uniref:Membrane fusion protein (MFP) family protein n=1 Tax=Belnapia rosea TaxID=938405 RepID=A0A1G7C0N8_9PROT|nr:HlyD family type I secretion periplasmic adaptor subunit [Belnapia rosea]SDE32256.1 HlyD family secretion protein [Belnapia rosea]
MQQLVQQRRVTTLPPVPLEVLRQQVGIIPQRPGLGHMLRLTALSCVLMLVPFIGWATMTRMEQAVAAGGLLVPEGRRKTVNLLEPGILRQMLVQEGSVVQAGQPLLRLDVTQAEATAIQARAAYWSGRARLARLAAEQAEQRQFTLPPDLEAEAAANPASAIFLQAERAFFAARWANFDGQTGVQERAITQLQEQVAGARAQREGAGRQLMAVREQIAGYNQLLTQGYASRFTVLNLQQQEAGFVATIGQANAQEAQLREGIIQAQRQLEGLRLTRLSEIANDLQATEATTAAALQQLRSAQDILTRREVLAPEAGKVTNIQAFTPGASIQAGQPILDLVPLNDRLVVEGQISPDDLEQVSVGQRVNIRLTPYKMRSVPMQHGRIVTVGSDAITREGSPPYILVRAEIDSDSLAQVPEVQPVAGMPAELYILGSPRTPISLVLAPVRNFIRHAFRD